MFIGCVVAGYAHACASGVLRLESLCKSCHRPFGILISIRIQRVGCLYWVSGCETWCQKWFLYKEMEKHLVPEPIGEGDLTSHWIRFKREFTQFLTATEKGDASKQVKLAIFLRIVGPRLNDLYETMPFADGEDRTKWSVVCEKLDSWCARRTSKHVRRDKFFQLKQEGKSVDQFVTGIENK